MLGDVRINGLWCDVYVKCGRGRRRIHIWPSCILVRLMIVWREGLWHKMKQYGVKMFVKVCEGLYSGMAKRVVLNGGKSRWFVVERGLRQGCPLFLLILNFNIYLMRMAEEFRESTARS